MGFGDIYYIIDVLADIKKIDNRNTVAELKAILERNKNHLSDLVSGIILYFSMSEMNCFISLYYLPFHEEEDIRNRKFGKILLAEGVKKNLFEEKVESIKLIRIEALINNYPNCETFIIKNEIYFCEGIYFITKMTSSEYFNQFINPNVPELLESLFQAIHIFKLDYSYFHLMNTLLIIFPRRIINTKCSAAGLEKSIKNLRSFMGRKDIRIETKKRIVKCVPRLIKDGPVPYLEKKQIIEDTFQYFGALFKNPKVENLVQILIRDIIVAIVKIYLDEENSTEFLLQHQDLLCSTLWMDRNFRNENLNHVSLTIRRLLCIDAEDFELYYREITDIDRDPKPLLKDIWEKCAHHNYFTSILIELTPKLLPYLPQQSYTNSQSSIIENIYCKKHILGKVISSKTPREIVKIIYFYFTPSTQILESSKEISDINLNGRLLSIAKMEVEFWNEYEKCLDNFISMFKYMAYIDVNRYELLKKFLHSSKYLVRDISKEFLDTKREKLWQLVVLILTTEHNANFNWSTLFSCVVELFKVNDNWKPSSLDKLLSYTLPFATGLKNKSCFLEFVYHCAINTRGYKQSLENWVNQNIRELLEKHKEFLNRLEYNNIITINYPKTPKILNPFRMQAKSEISEPKIQKTIAKPIARSSIGRNLKDKPNKIQMKVKAEPKIMKQSPGAEKWISDEQYDRIHRSIGKTEVLPIDEQPVRSTPLRKSGGSIFLPKTGKTLPKR